MSWEFVVALIIAVPLITFPAAFVWYVNAGSIFHALKGKIPARSGKHHVGSHRSEVPAQNNAGRPIAGR